MEKNYVASAQHDRGRFRSFLLMAVQRFLLNEGDRERALKRVGGARTTHWIVMGPAMTSSAFVEERCSREPSHAITPETLYERRWALTILERALNRLKSQHPAERVAALMPFLAGEASRGAYEQVAAELGLSEASLKVAVYRLKHQHQAALPAEIAETVAAESEVAEEIQYLMEVLSRAQKMP